MGNYDYTIIGIIVTIFLSIGVNLLCKYIRNKKQVKWQVKSYKDLLTQMSDIDTSSINTSSNENKDTRDSGENKSTMVINGEDKNTVMVGGENKSTSVDDESKNTKDNSEIKNEELEKKRKSICDILIEKNVSPSIAELLTKVDNDKKDIKDIRDNLFKSRLENIILEGLSKRSINNRNTLQTNIDSKNQVNNPSESENKTNISYKNENMWAQIPRALIDKIDKSEPATLPILFIGCNGVGKTTTIAKVATWIHTTYPSLSISMIAGDTFRSGAIEQLKIHGKKLDVPVFAREYGRDAVAVVREGMYKARVNQDNIVLVDTAGRMPYDRSKMNELCKIINCVSPFLIIFIAECVTGNSMVDQIRQFNSVIERQCNGMNSPRQSSGPHSSRPRGVVSNEVIALKGVLPLPGSARLLEQSSGSRGVVSDEVIALKGVLPLPGSARLLEQSSGRMIDGVIVSKVDVVGEKIGTLVNIAALGLPIHFIGTGQLYSDLHEFNSLVLCKLLGV